MGLLAAALVVPALASPASACSLAGPVPEPAAFHVWDPDTDDRVRLTVDERRLGADCSLANPHALDGDTFAWTERGHELEVHVYDLVEGTSQTLSFDREGPNEIGLAGDRLLLRDGDEVDVWDLAAEEWRALPFEAGEDESLQLEDGLVVRQDRGEEPSVSLYDAEEERWVVEQRSLASIGVPGDALVAEASDAWVLFTSGREAWAWQVGTDEARDTEELYEGRWSELDGDVLYSQEHGEPFVRLELPFGDLEEIGEPPVGWLRTADEGRLVLGDYSDPNGTGTTQSLAPPGERSTPGASLALAAVTLVATALSFGRRW